MEVKPNCGLVGLKYRSNSRIATRRDRYMAVLYLRQALWCKFRNIRCSEYHRRLDAKEYQSSHIGMGTVPVGIVKVSYPI